MTRYLHCRSKTSVADSGAPAMGVNRQSAAIFFPSGEMPILRTNSPPSYRNVSISVLPFHRPDTFPGRPDVGLYSRPCVFD
jgi:hypothetical protein